MTELQSIIQILSTFIAVAGGLWLGWGMITLGFGVNSQDGHGIRNGLLQMVGGGLVLAGGIYIGTLA